MPATRTSLLTWSQSLDRAAPAPAPAAGGHEAVEFSWLRGAIAAWTPDATQPRASMANPAQAWLSRVARLDALTVIDVQLHELRDLIALHGYVLEPALRSGTAVAIESPHRLTRLAPERFIDPGSSTRTRSSGRSTWRRGCTAAAPSRSPSGRFHGRRSRSTPGNCEQPGRTTESCR